LAPTSTAPTPIPTPIPSATCLPEPLYLPVAIRERCDPQHKRADVALVIDTSSSMTGQKLANAKSAAVMFVGLMDLSPGRDQMAVVRYDREAELVCELSHARTVIKAAIRGLASRNWTHIDAGLRTALAELQSPRHLDRNMPVMILLTDGIQTGTPGEELRAAAAVRNAGVRLYTIGLGADVDAAALRAMAGDASRYRFAPDSADLARIYAETASDIQCPAPAGGFWPGS
jgi:Ca-activated chloride channel family protein